MERGPIGRYVTGDLGAASYRAFLPGPLPPSPPLELDRLLLPLVQAQRALTRMDATASALPNRAALIYSYLRREAVLSSQIEGSRSSLSDLLAFEAGEAPGVPIDDVREVSNYVRRWNTGWNGLPTAPPSPTPCSARSTPSCCPANAAPPCIRGISATPRTGSAAPTPATPNSSPRSPVMSPPVCGPWNFL